LFGSSTLAEAIARSGFYDIDGLVDPISWRFSWFYVTWSTPPARSRAFFLVDTAQKLKTSVRLLIIFAPAHVELTCEACILAQKLARESGIFFQNRLMEAAASD
jgi:hypothetical protein